ncbi:hypothetical protein INT45_008779 [Circinella minor]|uniref:C2H2-type domain-containing protein n=1 Tax=Circinella minor TaxID=1195481 RepID=A0A8H7VKW3_9FUNG|nr:hypothetical protein INT45_008779 [Circinella minor]
MDTIDKPKLPSIQLMLQGIGAEEKTATTPNEHRVSSSGHKRHASDLMTNSVPYSTHPSSHAPRSLFPHPEMTASGLPGHMQKLSISNSTTPVAPIEPNLHQHHHHHELAPPPLRPTAQGYHFQSPTSMLLQQHRSPRNMHSRSFSDYSHPYPTPLYSSSPAAPMMRDGSTTNNTNNATTTATNTTSVNNTRARPQYLQTSGYHRRAISTNTLDLILQPTLQRPIDYHSNNNNQQQQPPQLYASSSTTTTTTSTNATPQSPIMSDGGDSESHHSDSSDKPRKEAGSNKYHCPYCDKGFSRPSSLRIHTYSHTGEKPFVCPEPGCSRKFSVQSNMRRHLRVHRLGRATKRSNTTTTTTSPSATAIASSGNNMDSTTMGTTMDRRVSTKPLAVKPASWDQPQEHYHLHHHHHQQQHLSAFNLPSLIHDEQ